eukprot:3904554-Rhodomonas_salina.1
MPVAGKLWTRVTTNLYEAVRIGAGWGYSWVLFCRSTPNSPGTNVFYMGPTAWFRATLVPDTGYSVTVSDETATILARMHLTTPEIGKDTR